MLCIKKEEVSIDILVYIKFPFGMVDYNGLKQFQLFHHELNHKTQQRRNSDMAIKTWGYLWY